MLPRPVHFPHHRPQPQYQTQPATTAPFPYNPHPQQQQFNMPQQQQNVHIPQQIQHHQINMSQPQQPFPQQQQQFQPMFQQIDPIQQDIQFFQQPQQIQMTQPYAQQPKFQSQQPQQQQNANVQNMNIDPALLLQFPAIKQEVDSTFSPSTNSSEFGFVNSDFIQIQNEDQFGLNVLTPLSTSPLEHEFEEDRLKGSTPIDMKTKNKSTVSKLQQPSTAPQFYSVSMPVPGGHPSSFNSSYGSFNSMNGFDSLPMDERQLDALVSEISGDTRIDLINERRRRRRESHNAVERRRRDNINEKIQELATLLPDLAHDTQNRPNKGVILRRSVDYIRYIQQYSMKLEQRQRELENAVQRLGIAQELGLSFVLGSALDVAPYYIPGQVNGTPPPMMSVVREEPAFQQQNQQPQSQQHQGQPQMGQQQIGQQQMSNVIQ